MRLQKRLLKNGKMDARITLTWFLEMSSGFYLMLLEELRSTYDLDYPFLGRTVCYGYVEKPEVEPVSSNVDPVVHRNNCNYIAQHCLVHLGDLARYRNQIRKAETYYRQAIQISPSSGQAYNQIALLEANRGNKLASVFYYVRSLAVKYPFPAASTNLMTILSRFLSNPPSKIINASTFTHSFLRLEASLRHSFKLKSAASLRQECNDSLTSLIATESLQTWELIQIATISLYQMESQEFLNLDLEESSLSLEENQIRQISCEFVASLLNSLLLPVYTTKQGGDPLLEYFGLPVVKILLQWILNHPTILNQKRFLLKKQIWPTFCTLLNQLNQIDSVSNFEEQEDLTLPEDFDLQGFLPLSKNSSKPNSKEPGYTFFESNKSDIHDRSLLLFRAKKLIEIGKSFAEDDFPIRRISYDGDKFEIVDYEAQYDEENDVLSNLEEKDEDEEEAIEFICDEKERKLSSGILKMSKPEDRLISSPPKKNVRVNSILKNIADRDNKQVTFRTPSPASTHSGSQGSLSQNENSILFSVPPPAIHVPPPNFLKSANPPLPNNRQVYAPSDSSLFMSGAQSHPQQGTEPVQPYNMGRTYSLFSGPNLLGQNFPTPPEPQQPFLLQQEQGVLLPQSSLDHLFRQGNNF